MMETNILKDENYWVEKVQEYLDSEYKFKYPDITSYNIRFCDISYMIIVTVRFYVKEINNIYGTQVGIPLLEFDYSSDVYKKTINYMIEKAEYSITKEINKLEENQNKELKEGDYVLATKYFDGNPNDPWYVGYYKRQFYIGNSIRYEVTDEYGDLVAGSFRRIAKIDEERGKFILIHKDIIDWSDRSLWWWKRCSIENTKKLIYQLVIGEIKKI